MAATPQYGTMVFYGLVTGKSYIKDVYLSDVANAALRWDEGAGAGASSGVDWIATEPVRLYDFSVVTGTADTTKLQITRDGIPTGDILRYTIHLTTLNNRPQLNIYFRAGSKISALQLA